MLIQRVNRTDPEKVFIIVDNGEGATLPAGAAVIWETGTDANGLLVQQPDTGYLQAFAGVLDASMASATGNYTLCQVYGYSDTALVLVTNTTQANGLPLVPVAGANYLASTPITQATNASTIAYTFGVLQESLSTATAAAATKVFIRAM